MGFSSVTDLLDTAVILSPVALVLALALAWFRARRGQPWKRAARDSTLDVLTLGSLMPVVILTLVNPGGPGGSLVLVPFSEITYLGLGLTGLYQNGGNIALFMPFGALLPLTLRHRLAGFGRVAAVAAAVSVTVEALQYFLGRVASVDDVILNCTGALIGAALTRHWWRRRPQRGEASAGFGTPASSPHSP
ncbi:VanZ family protein [Nocardiopsis halotolerans]|uniref:VanZ family protein n=1 Tax=Nocardiopsis halotolerans TaxID=124252 RepID=UPI000349083A|nr:VanZ family protein [Nocardiopsis halotolerans]